MGVEENHYLHLIVVSGPLAAHLYLAIRHRENLMKDSVSEINSRVRMISQV